MRSSATVCNGVEGGVWGKPETRNRTSAFQTFTRMARMNLVGLIFLGPGVHFSLQEGRPGLIVVDAGWRREELYLGILDEDITLRRSAEKGQR